MPLRYVLDSVVLYFYQLAKLRELGGTNSVLDGQQPLIEIAIERIDLVLEIMLLASFSTESFVC